ncbi:Outer membrane beta-barrel assembly protein BamD [hydrothermal vent metagenome]|uniref:Outer membrane beta-barrel assembly protein BamD n=1 Tax=hydrothermal vent metagenome TaxID=652676 RepID=A0A3B0WCC8_9ZZZZ
MRQLFLLLLIANLFACASSGSHNEDDETADYTAKELYEEAQADLSAAEFQSAVKLLESLEARYPFDTYAKQAQLEIAYAYYKFEELDQATSAIERFARLHPRDPHMDYVYYLKGLINFNRGQGLLDDWFPREPSRHDPEILEQAFNNFSTLVRRYPNSIYAGDSYQRMVYLRNQMAEKEILIAEFYIERKSWLSAAKRAKAVIVRYPKTIWTHRALEIMLLSYKKLELATLAADTQKIIDFNDFSDITTPVDPGKYGNAPASSL